MKISKNLFHSGRIEIAMHGKADAIKQIVSFLNSEEQVLLLTGTQMEKKHVLAFSLILSNYRSSCNILFRANNATSAISFLTPIIELTSSPKTGVNLGNGKCLYIDSINPRSWLSTPRNINVAMVYPLEALTYETGGDCVQDLIRKSAKKIFLVSSFDNVDFGWTDQFKPAQVVYDAEDEDPEYHKRVKAALSQSMIPQQISGKLPEYAKQVPTEYLVQILCKGACGTSRWAKLNKPYPGKTALGKAAAGEYTATCLKCGKVATDNYNWYR